MVHNKNMQGNSALHWALIGRNSAPTSLLVNKGKDTSILNLLNTQVLTLL